MRAQKVKTAKQHPRFRFLAVGLLSNSFALDVLASQNSLSASPTNIWPLLKFCCHPTTRSGAVGLTKSPQLLFSYSVLYLWTVCGGIWFALEQNAGSVNPSVSRCSKTCQKLNFVFRWTYHEKFRIPFLQVSGDPLSLENPFDFRVFGRWRRRSLFRCEGYRFKCLNQIPTSLFWNRQSWMYRLYSKATSQL